MIFFLITFHNVIIYLTHEQVFAAIGRFIHTSPPLHNKQRVLRSFPSLSQTDAMTTRSHTSLALKTMRTKFLFFFFLEKKKGLKKFGIQRKKS